MQVAFLDHYDSFSFNLIDWLFSDTELELIYRPYDSPGLAAELRRRPLPLVLSPGPKNPLLLPETMQILQENLGLVPVLGICLGHQCLGLALGGQITRARSPFHGSSQTLRVHSGSGFFQDLALDCRVARYNSLVIAEGSLPRQLISARNSDEEIEAIEWYGAAHPAIGIQFHPESFLSDGVESLKQKWVELVRRFYREPA